MTQIWRLHLKPGFGTEDECSSITYEKLFKCCQNKGVISTGWRIDKPDICPETHVENTNTEYGRSLSQIRHFILDMQKGDYVVVSGEHTWPAYVCKITGDWYYEENFCKPGIAPNLRKCKWSQGIDAKVFKDAIHQKKMPMVMKACGKFPKIDTGDKCIIDIIKHLHEEYI